MLDCILCAVTLILGFVLFLYFFFTGDADLYLRLAEHFGKSVESLQGEVVWITGASSGIGEYLSYDLARAGCKLILSARRQEELERVKKTCLASSKLKDEDVLVLPLDMLDYDSHKTAFDKVIAAFGKLDILVNNAGRSQRAWWPDITIDVDRELFEIDVFSVINLTRTVLGHMINRKKGHMVITGSLAGKIASPQSSTYTGAKHALVGYFDTLRMEQPDIDVTMVCPGPVASDLLRHAFTGQTGETVNKSWGPDKNRIPTSRCSHLMAVAIANRLYEVWISYHPPLVLTYMMQYFPSLSRWVVKKLGVKAIMKMKDGKPQHQD